MLVYTITCSNVYNYGAVLQAYALQRFLLNNNFQSEVINYYPPYLRKISSKYQKNVVAKIARSILYYPDYTKSGRVFSTFCSNYLRQTEPCYDKNDILRLPKADVYIVGSDQVWNPKMSGNGMDDNYYLDYISAKKISYAASIGTDDIEEYGDYYKTRLKDYYRILLREKSNSDYFNTIGIPSDYVLDPVFLLEKEDWKRICNDKYDREKYVLVYALHHKQEIYDYAKRLANRNGLKVYVVSVEYKEFFRGHDRFFWNPSVIDFLSLVKDSSAVVTNSFHGIAFSVLFDKPLHLFDTEKNDNRIKNIVNTLKLERNVVDIGCNDIIRPAKVNDDCLKKLREKSMSLLLSALCE